MKRQVDNWSVRKLHAERDKISFPEYQRQANLWSDQKKSLLIDSILRDIDIPKLYFNRTKDGNYEVVDGQQRLWALWGYLDETYAYAGETAKLKFSELKSADREAINDYKLQVTVFHDADDDYLRELFTRLQLGLLLLTGEKLHASTGAMKDFIFDDLPKEQFVKKLGIPARRYAKETLCAQICVNSFTRKKLGGFARTRFEDLQQFFLEYAQPVGKDRIFFVENSSRIAKLLRELWDSFGERTKDLKNRSYILSVYLLYEELATSDSWTKKDQKVFVDFVFLLWRRLKEEVKAGIDRRNRDLYAFETFISSAPGEKYQIERRHERMSDYFTHFKKTGEIKGDRSHNK